MRKTVILLGDVGAEIVSRTCALPVNVQTRSDLQTCVDDEAAAQAEAVVLRSGVTLDRAALEVLPRLRLIVLAGSGIDKIDTAALARRGVHLERSPELSADAVAELAVSGLILLARRAPLGQALLARSIWAKGSLLGEPLGCLRVAIWGAGPVGRACAQRLQPVVADLRFARWPSVPFTFPTAAPEQLQEEADIHVLCLPLRSQTKGLVDRQFIESCRARRPYIIVVGRFELVSWPDLLEGLAQGIVRGALVDPIDRVHVPAIAASLAAAPPFNLIVTPHLGAQREDVRLKLAQWVEGVLTDQFFPKPYEPTTTTPTQQ